MIKWVSVFILSGLLFSGVIAAEKVIKLLPPDKTGGKPLMQALSERKSSRKMKATPLSKKELSNLFFAATGVNRADGRRTNPSARNVQDIILYAAMEQGFYRYDPVKHELILEQERDLRPFCGVQKKMHTTVPLVLIPVSDTGKMKADNFPADKIGTYAPLHIGFVAQNIYLYAAAAGFGTVTCALVDTVKLAEEMKVPKEYFVFLTIPFGRE